MKIYIEPSNTLAVSPSASNRLSAVRQYFVFIPMVKRTVKEQSQSTFSWRRALSLDIYD